MTLSQFARQRDIKYRTAQSWLRRGKLRQTEDGFEVVPEAERATNPRIIGRSSPGNRRLAGQPDTSSDSILRDGLSDKIGSIRDGACQGCAEMVVRVAALEIENETLLATQRLHAELLADLHGRLSAIERTPNVAGPVRRAPVPQRIGRGGRVEGSIQAE